MFDQVHSSPLSKLTIVEQVYNSLVTAHYNHSGKMAKKLLICVASNIAELTTSELKLAFAGQKQFKI